MENCLAYYSGILICLKRLLKAIRTGVEHYGDYSDEAARRVAGNEWWEIEEKLRYSLRIAASEAEAKGQLSAMKQVVALGI